MAKLTVAVVLLWAAWWVAGWQAIERGTRAWFAAEEAAGREAGAAALGVSGFPLTFEVAATDLRLADPAAGTGWALPLVQLSIPAWTPWRLAAVLPPSQRITAGGEAFVLGSDLLTARLDLAPRLSLPLERTEVQAEALALHAAPGPILTLDRLTATTETVAGDAAQQRVTLDASGIAAPSLDLATAGLPEKLQSLRLEAVARLGAPLDRHAAEAPIALRSLDLTELRLDWGELGLEASGRLTVDAAGLPEGRIDMALTGWRKAITVAVALGLIHPDAAQTWERVGTMLSAPSGGERLPLPLVFTAGRMSLGPLPLGPAPRIAQPQ